MLHLGCIASLIQGLSFCSSLNFVHLTIGLAPALQSKQSKQKRSSSLWSTDRFPCSSCLTYSTKAKRDPFLDIIPYKYAPSIYQPITVYFSLSELFSPVLIDKIFSSVPSGPDCLYTVFIKIRYDFYKFFWFSSYARLRFVYAFFHLGFPLVFLFNYKLLVFFFNYLINYFYKLNIILQKLFYSASLRSQGNYHANRSFCFV